MGQQSDTINQWHSSEDTAPETRTDGDRRQSNTDDTTTDSCSSENAPDREMSVASCSSTSADESPRK